MKLFVSLKDDIYNTISFLNCQHFFENFFRDIFSAFSADLSRHLGILPEALDRWEKQQPGQGCCFTKR